MRKNIYEIFDEFELAKTKKDKIYNLNIGVNNRTTDGINGAFSPYVGFGTYWKIKLKK